MSKNNHRNILLIDDHYPNLLTATAFLDLLNYTHIVAKSGHEGIEQFQLFNFDLILMDIQMPILDGVETARQIKEIEKNLSLPATPIFAMTANFAKGDLNQWEAAGIEDVIPKPFNVDYFSKMLARHCNKRVDL